MIQNKKKYSIILGFFIVWLLILAILNSCIQTKKLSGTHEYTVKAGDHKMQGNRIVGIKQNSFNFRIYTNQTWIWTPPEKNGFSKVTGIRWIIGEVENSARLVYWNKEAKHPPLADKREFWAYFYLKGTSPQEDKTLKKKLCDVVIGQSYVGFVGNENNHMIVRVNGKQHSVKCTGEGLSFLCFPYIGGTYTIGHDWNVKIEYY